MCVLAGCARPPSQPSSASAEASQSRNPTPAAQTAAGTESRPAANREAPANDVGGGLLPAGLYWVGYDTCDDCPRPTAATVVVADDEKAARQVVARVPAGLPLGYPLVVHVDELGLVDRSIRGIAVVLGLHETPERGVEWLAAVQPHVPEARLLRLGESRSWEGGQGLVVSRIAAGPPVNAYDRAAVEQLENQQREEIAPEVLAEQLSPLCAIDAGELFVVGIDDLQWYRWAPVRCGDRAAYVPWRATLLGWATVIPVDGGYRLRQVTHVECDQPDIEEWPYSAEEGRGGAERSAPGALGGC